MSDPIPPTSSAAVGSANATPSLAVASWSAIFAGAFVAVSASLILLTLGAGFGLEAVLSSPRTIIDVHSLTVNGAIWLIATQWISAGLGGYIAGRLRRRWFDTHAHEVFFRDTAHGLVTWSVATVLVSALLSASLLHISAVTGPEVAAGKGAATDYDTERLFRPTAEANSSTSTAPSAQTSYAQLVAEHLAANARDTGTLPDEDRVYLQQLVSLNTGLTPVEAQQRVAEYLASNAAAIAKSKANAEAARQAASQAAIYLALSLLIGAFVASVAAAIGGHLRDEHP